MQRFTQIAKTVLWLLPLLFLVTCTQARKPAALAELPDVVPQGIAIAPGDERPIIKTQSGYVLSSIPGVPVPPAAPLTYTTYYGPSN